MRRLSFFCMNILLATLGLFLIFQSAPTAAYAEGKYVYVGGYSAGFTLNIEGVQIVALSEVVTEKGTTCPANTAGLRNGDLIVSVNGIKVDSLDTLQKILNKNEDKKLKLTAKRNNAEFSAEITPEKDVNGKYKMGVLIRDKVSGIGTITYFDKENGRFGALGHPVIDENDVKMNADGGTVCGCSIVSVNRGVRGKAGELKGLFVADESFGTSDKLNHCGLFGKIRSDIKLSEKNKVEIGSLSEAHPGNACIYSTVNGQSPQKFDICIVKVDENNPENKNFVVKITDKSLIEKTGGIVQGMSGSPILQDGKLVGAITHVFLNDPTRGYGIGIENMLGN